MKLKSNTTMTGWGKVTALNVFCTEGKNDGNIWVNRSGRVELWLNRHMRERYKDEDRCWGATDKVIKRKRHKLQYRWRTAYGLCSNLRDKTRKRGRGDRRGVMNDSSAARDALASSSYAADLGLMSCNKTWPSTPEIGPLTTMLRSLRQH